MKKVALVLSGCGVFDGAEIHESVILLLAAEKCGASVSFFAPDIHQAHTIDHSKGVESKGEVRGVLAESARIARGNILPLSEYDAKDFDALLFAGGFGAAKNLCSFAFDGADCVVDTDVKSAIENTFALKKSMGFACISPIIAAKVLGQKAPILTIGKDAQTAAAIEKMGAKHKICDATSFVKDENLNIYSTPAYMLAKNTVELEMGISAMVEAILK